MKKSLAELILISSIALCIAFANGTQLNANDYKQAKDKIMPLLGMWKIQISGFSENEIIYGNIGVIRIDDGIVFRGESNDKKYYIHGIGKLKNKALLLELSIKKKKERSTKCKRFLNCKAELNISNDAKHLEGKLYNVNVERKSIPKHQVDIKGNMSLDKIYIPIELLEKVR